MFDENLSRKLSSRLADLYPGSIHVSDVKLLRTQDSLIWQFAKDNEFAIVTADGDFFDLAMNFGPPPKVIWLRRWIHPTRDAEMLLRRQAIRVFQFCEDPELGLLVLDLS